MPCNHLILCCPFLLPLQSFPASVLSIKSVLRIRWPNYQEFQLQHQSFPWIFRTDFLLDWLVWYPCSPRDSQESSPTCFSKASILRCSAFFMVQLSHPYMTTGKTIALTKWTFVSQVMSLLFNMLSRLVIPSLTRSKRLLISWRQSPSAVIFSPKIKSLTVSIFTYLFATKWWDWMPWS